MDKKATVTILAAELVTTSEAAEQLGVTRRRVIKLIEDKRLPATKLGRDYVIRRADLMFVAERRPGRPRKATDVVTGS